MTNTLICPIWGTEATEQPSTYEGRLLISDRAGGGYELTGSAEAMLKGLSDTAKARLSQFIVEQNIQDRTPLITSETLHWAKTAKLLSVTARCNLLLKLTQKFWPLGEWVYIINPRFLSVLGSLASPMNNLNPYGECVTYWQNAVNQGLAKFNFQGDGTANRVALTIPGHEYVESLGPRLVDSEQIFVVMWFSEQTEALYHKAIEPAIRASGYAPMRIDRSDYNDKICDQIIAEIRRSKAVIVDLTCGTATDTNTPGQPKTIGVPRGGVYYEAGFAKGLNLPVIWMVNDALASTENVVHFDVRQYNQIRWNETNLEEKREELKQRIRATLGEGPVRLA